MTRLANRREVAAIGAGMLACALARHDARAEGSGGNDAAMGILTAQVRARKIPGTQIAVVHRGRIVLSEALGLASVEFGAPVNRDTLFAINSATKCFTGVAVMQLVEAGRVNLDASIADYVDDIPAAWRAARVRQLLSHASGLPNIIGRDGLIGDKGEAEAWALVRTLPVEAPPGTRFSYNQTNYLLLAKLIDNVSGMPFTAFMSERQFKPAGMTRARFADTFDVVANMAQPYSFMRRVRGADERVGNDLSHWTDDMPPFLRTAGGLCTTATDLATWLIALTAGRLFSRTATLKAMWAPTKLNDGRDNIWAQGWPVVGQPTRRAFAGIGGGRSAFFVYPDDDLSIVVLTNLVGGNPETFIHDLANCYVRRPDK